MLVKASDLKIDRKNIRRWKNEADKLLQSKNKKKTRHIAGGRKPFWTKLEEELAN